MRTKMLLALAAIFAFATVSSADQVFDVSHLSIERQSNPSPTGDYFIAPVAGGPGAMNLVFAGGPFVDSTFNGATETIGADAGGGFVESSDLITQNADGTSNVFLSLFSTSGDFVPAGTLSSDGSPADTFLIFFGATAGGSPIDFAGGTVNSAFIDVFAGGTSIFAAGAIDLIPLGFDVQSGSFAVSLGAGTAAAGIDTVTFDINVTKAVPEPTSVALLGVLGVGLFTRRRR